MRRRAFLTAAVTVGLPGSLGAQSVARPLIGYVSGRSLGTDAHILAAFREGLKKTGYVEGRDVAIEFRWADGHYDRLPMLMAQVVASKPDVIVAVGGNPAGLAAKAATSTIPIVFGAGADPVGPGWQPPPAR